MKNVRFELEDKRYIQLENNLEKKDSGEISNIKEFKNIEKSKLKKINEDKTKKEIKIELKTELKTKTKPKIKTETKTEIKTKIKTKPKKEIEKALLKMKIEKSILEKEKINIKDKLEEKLNNEIQIIRNSLNNKLKGNNKKHNNQVYTSCFNSEKRREEKKLIKGEAPQIKTPKDKNGFFEDKNKSGKYIKEYIINNNIMKNIYLIIIISLLQLSNNNIQLFSNITLKINGTGTKNVLGNDFSSNNYPNMIYIN